MLFFCHSYYVYPALKERWPKSRFATAVARQSAGTTGRLALELAFVLALVPVIGGPPPFLPLPQFYYFQRFYFFPLNGKLQHGAYLMKANPPAGPGVHVKQPQFFVPHHF